MPIGQTDNDMFVFTAADFQAGIYDTIIDFHDGEDAISLQGFGFTDANRPAILDADYGLGVPAAVISLNGGTAGITVIGTTADQLQGNANIFGEFLLY